MTAQNGEKNYGAASGRTLDQRQYDRHERLNPIQIVLVGPGVDYCARHDRSKFNQED